MAPQQRQQRFEGWRGYACPNHMTVMVSVSLAMIGWRAWLGPQDAAGVRALLPSWVLPALPPEVYLYIPCFGAAHAVRRNDDAWPQSAWLALECSGPCKGPEWLPLERMLAMMVRVRVFQLQF